MDSALSERRASPVRIPPASRSPAPAGLDAGLLSFVLDEIDYGLVVAASDGTCHYTNNAANELLLGGGALHRVEHRLRSTTTTHDLRFMSALADACGGSRRMIILGRRPHELPVALIPMRRRRAGDEPLALMLLGRPQACPDLSLDFFSRVYGLTASESAVLHGLSRGDSPKQLAASLGVAISTIRTQIGSVRLKTETDSIRDLTRRLAALPPITRAIKLRA